MMVDERWIYAMLFSSAKNSPLISFPLFSLIEFARDMFSLLIFLKNKFFASLICYIVYFLFHYLINIYHHT